MSNATKNSLYSLVLLLSVVAVYLYRDLTAPAEPLKVQGTTMGKIQYTVKYFDPEDRDFGEEVDSLLKAFNQSLSTYIPDSEISRFNQSADSFRFETDLFYPVLESSRTIYAATNGAFDPTVGPLVNAWGFGPEEREEMTQAKVDSLLALVGFEHIKFNRQKVRKTKPNMYLDFSAIAKGYAIDVIAMFLEERDIQDYLVIIGGEARCRGNNGEGDGWVIGIDNPEYKERGGQVGIAYLSLSGLSVATSGNYRNYYVKDGKKYAHTINPNTGYPVEHNLLSASVLAEDCMTADAYATAFMVLGKDKGLELLRNNPELQALLVYEEDGEMQTYTSDSVKEMLVQ